MQISNFLYLEVFIQPPNFQLASYELAMNFKAILLVFSTAVAHAVDTCCMPNMNKPQAD
jgi:hypothetical protein